MTFRLPTTPTYAPDSGGGGHSAPVDRRQDALPLSLKLYRLATTLSAPAAPLLIAWRARRGREDRARRGERLGRPSATRPDGALVWFHAASVGETNAVLPLIAGLQERRPDIAVLLTTGTTTSARLAEARASGTILHQYVPLDATVFARRFLSYWRPHLAVFAESEIWPNLIFEAAGRGLPLVIVNGRVSDRSFRRWQQRPATASALFRQFDLILAQNAAFADRFTELGAGTAIAAGNLKIDAPPPPADERLLQRLRDGIGGRPVMLAASTHPGEEEIVVSVHKQLAARHPDLLTIICPRHPHRGADVAAIVETAGLRAACRSREDALDSATDIYVADTIGELGLFYAVAPLAFVGGSLVAHGGQNPVEAIKHGTAVLSGPHVQNFAEAYRGLREAEACADVHSANDLAARADALLRDEALRERMIKAGAETVTRMSGALGKSLDALNSRLPPVQKSSREG